MVSDILLINVQNHDVNSRLFRCGEMGWVDWEMTDLDGGYMYCCDLEQAAAVFEEIAGLGLAQSSGLIQAPGGNTPAPTPAPTSASAACSVNLDSLTGN